VGLKGNFCLGMATFSLPNMVSYLARHKKNGTDRFACAAIRYVTQ